MRTAKTGTMGILGALLLFVASAGAASASTISMVWISTSGAGVGVGTSTLTGVSVGDTAVLEIGVLVSSVTTGIQAIGASFAYDPNVIAGVLNTPCPPTPGNFLPGACGGVPTAIGAGFLSVLYSSLADAGGPPGEVLADTVVGTTPGSGQANGAFFELTHLTFVAVGPGTTGGLFFSVLDGVVDIGGAFSPTVPGTGATISIVPEPATFGMLALGLVAFALRRR